MQSSGVGHVGGGGFGVDCGGCVAGGGAVVVVCDVVAGDTGVVGAAAAGAGPPPHPALPASASTTSAPKPNGPTLPRFDMSCSFASGLPGTESEDIERCP